MFDRHLKVWPKGVPTEIDFPEHHLAQNLAATAERQPDKTAILYHGNAISFATLAAQVEALAGWLQEVAGVQRGDRVLLYMQNSPQFVIAYYAILRADAVVVPVNPMNRHLELDYLIADTGARVALCGQELLEHIRFALGAGLDHVVAAAYADMADPAFDIPPPEGLRDRSPEDYGIAGVTRLPDAVAAGHSPTPMSAGPDDLAVIAYTSGTTGKQKGCMHTHRTVMVTVAGGLEWNRCGLGQASLCVLPLFHVTGMQNSMNGPIYCGETMVIMTRWDRRVAAQLIARHRVARWRLIATMAIDLVNDPDLDSYDLSSLQMIGGGGAAMPEPVARRFKEITGLDYIEGYGMSETMAGTHINPVDRPRRQCLGIPVFGVDSRVIDPETHAEMGVDQPGEIVIDAPQNFLGYWNNTAATEAAFLEIDGKRFLRTGDIGRYDEDGYFFMVDRVKRMVNAAGFKVWPTEVESMIHDHPQVADVCIVGYPDPRRGESVMAYVVPRGPLTADDLIDWCRREMAAYKCPSKIEFLDSLPRSPSGKVQWLQLQERAAEQVEAVANTGV